MKKIPLKKLTFKPTTIAALTEVSGGVLRTLGCYSIYDCKSGDRCPTAPGSTNQLTDSCNTDCGIWCDQTAMLVTSCA